MSIKYYENKLEDYSPKSTNTEIQSKIEPETDQLWTNTRLKYQTMNKTDYSVYTGTAGVALLHLRKSVTNPKLLKDALSFLNLDKLNNREVTFLCGDSGPLAIGAVVHHKLGNRQEMDGLINRLLTLSSRVINLQSGLPDELLYGRAGYLFALLYVNSNISPKPIGEDIIKPVISALLSSGQSESKAKKMPVPLMYHFSERYYLGAAHGLAGILYILLQAAEFLTKTELHQLIRPTINYLSTVRLASGNYKISIDSDADTKIQWCHGAPGFTSLFCKAYAIFRDEEYLKLALSCGDTVWRRGLLKKGYSMCHGVSGNAYTFLELYQTTQDLKHLHRAYRFAQWCLNFTTDCEGHTPDRPLSLFEGVSGRLYFLEEMKNPENAKFPGYQL